MRSCGDPHGADMSNALANPADNVGAKRTKLRVRQVALGEIDLGADPTKVGGLVGASPCARQDVIKLSATVQPTASQRTPPALRPPQLGDLGWASAVRAPQFHRATPKEPTSVIVTRLRGFSVAVSGVPSVGFPPRGDRILCPKPRHVIALDLAAALPLGCVPMPLVGALACAALADAITAFVDAVLGCEFG